MTQEEYILAHIDEEGELLQALTRDAHVNLLRPRMLSGHLQGRLLKMLCRLAHPHRVLEIGTYTGYATLCIAEALDDDALIHTVERDDEMEDFMMKYISRSPHRSKICVHFGDALEVVPSLGERFDMVFIDAGKHEYTAYYEMVLPLVRQGGLIVADNTLWDGKLWDRPSADKQTAGILAFNEQVRHDERVETVILPLRDGLTLLWKK